MSEPAPQLPIALGSDHAGFALKRELQAFLAKRGESVVDVGCHDEQSCDYPDFAHALATGLREGRYRMGILVCGTGVGMSMAANRHAGVRAALCSDEFTARMAREHNDANVLCVGSRVVGPGLAQEIVRAFLEGRFEGGRHARRVGKIDGG
jgi:ribose 5-phosphate isomerase B